MPQESHQEFTARMDRARAENEAGNSKAGIIGLILYVAAASGYLYFSEDIEIQWLAVLLVALDSLLAFAIARLMMSVYKSQKL